MLDEADTMFDAGFGPDVRALLRPLRSKAQPAACVLVAATVSKVSPSLASQRDHPAQIRHHHECSIAQ